MGKYPVNGEEQGDGCICWRRYMYIETAMRGTSNACLQS